MNKEQVKKAIAELKKNSKQRKFNQSFDLIISLQDLNLKKPEEQVEFFVTLHHKPGRKVKVCALVGPELEEQAKTVCDMHINQDEFPKYKEKKLAKKVASEHDYFIAQANIMPKVAGAFGRVLGPRGKMPNPKAGCIVPGNANLKALYEKLQYTVKISARKIPVIQVLVGKEDQTEAEVIDNVLDVLHQLINNLPKEKNNIKSVYLKLTMSKPIKLN